MVTLILNRFMNATAGDAYRIGNARLGGFNGIPAFPVLNVPGDPSAQIYGTPYYYVVIVCLLGAYLVARAILASGFGRVLIGIRENDARMELLGYNVPAYKTAIFTISGAMAGLAGCLFANWAEIVTPSVFSLGQTAEVLIWVIVGGLGTLIGPMLGAVALGSLKIALGNQTAGRQLAGARLHPDPGRAADPARLRARPSWHGAGASRSRRRTGARRAPIAAASRCRTPSDERDGGRDP